MERVYSQMRLEKIYSEMPDWELSGIVNNDINSYVPEAREVILKEYEKRNIARKFADNQASADSGKNSEPPEAIAGDPVQYEFDFTGTGSEYFRIWIVNLLLSIITLGIYSAWAKVRTNQYMYRSLKLGGSGFDYHGRPVAILKGRIIAAALIIGLNVSQRYSPIAYLVLLIFFMAVLPWLITRSLAFRMRNSSWRGIRFSFRAGAATAAKIMYGYGFITGITSGIAYPLQYRMMKKFAFENTWFGTSKISFNAETWDFYKVFLKMAGMGMAAFLLFMVMLMGFTSFPGSSPAIDPFGFEMITVAVLLFYAFILLITVPYFRAGITNVIWNGVRLGPASFRSTMSSWKLIRLWAGIAFLTLVTLGLYWPWGVMKLFRYRTDNLQMITAGGLDNYTADPTVEVGAAGEEITDAFDFDISF